MSSERKLVFGAEARHASLTAERSARDASSCRHPFVSDFGRFKLQRTPFCFNPHPPRPIFRFCIDDETRRPDNCQLALGCPPPRTCSPHIRSRSTASFRLSAAQAFPCSISHKYIVTWYNYHPIQTDCPRAGVDPAPPVHHITN